MIVITKQPETFLPHRKHAHLAKSMNQAALRQIAGGAGFRHRTLYVAQCQLDPAGPVQWLVRELAPLPQASHWGRHRHFAVTLHPDAIATFVAVMESAETHESYGRV
ncbi:MAG: hypothetical protein V4675_03540 [Verrucomicrobiota bacterium]